MTRVMVATVSFALAAAASAILLIAPAVSTSSTSVSVVGSGALQPPNGSNDAPADVSNQTLIESQGPGVMRFLALPVVIAAIGAAGSATRIGRPLDMVCAALLTGLCLLGIASIGILFVPAAAAMWAAVAAPHAPRGGT